MKLFSFPKRVTSDYDGYSCFIELYQLIKKMLFDDITIDFDKTEWFDANLLAILGSILNKAQNDLNTIRIINLKPKVLKIFSKNHFLSNFGGEKIEDYYGTTIKYKRFKATDEKLFKVYLDNELLSKKELPKMTIALRKKVNESIFEIFNNAIIHGASKDIFSCGQYYPANSKLDFTIVDLGKTIKGNVNKYLGKKLSGSETIEWAILEGNTTKVGDIPGGLGLSLIRSFLKLNFGKIQILSADGYWYQERDQTRSLLFVQRFDGTMVNLEFNIADQNEYCLSNEIKSEDIF
jgi:hypothetical protein